MTKAKGNKSAKVTKKSHGERPELVVISEEEAKKQYDIIEKHSNECMELLHKRFFQEELTDADKARLGVMCMALASIKYVSLIAGFIQKMKYEDSLILVDNSYRENYEVLFQQHKKRLVNNTENKTVN